MCAVKVAASCVLFYFITVEKEKEFHFLIHIEFPLFQTSPVSHHPALMHIVILSSAN